MNLTRQFSQREGKLCNLFYYFSKVLKRCDYEAQKEVEIQQMRDKEAGIRPSGAVEAARKREQDKLRGEKTKDTLFARELKSKWRM